jgi:hypothetical protein
LLKEFLKKNKKAIENHVDLGSEPMFDCPPVIYSPPHDPYANITPVRPEDRFPFLRQIVRHVLTQNVHMNSIGDYVKAKRYQDVRDDIL